MDLAETDIQNLLALAMTAARRSADYIQGEVGKQREVLRKEGGSSHASQIVTEVDLESQRLILDTLGRSIEDYKLGLLTEECQDDSSRHRSEYFWCIDPLDGTLPFTEGVVGYSVSIALVARDGDPIIGVVLDPVTDTLVHAVRGGGAFRNGAPLAIGIGRRLTLVMDRSFAAQEIYDELLARVGAIAELHGLDGVDIIKQGGAAMNACWVIEHAPAVYFKFPKPTPGGGSLWDYAATARIFGELAGALACDMHGRPLDLNRDGHTFMNEDGVVYSSSRELGEAVIGLYSEFS